MRTTDKRGDSPFWMHLITDYGQLPSPLLLCVQPSNHLNCLILEPTSINTVAYRCKKPPLKFQAISLPPTDTNKSKEWLPTTFSIMQRGLMKPPRYKAGSVMQTDPAQEGGPPPKRRRGTSSPLPIHGCKSRLPQNIPVFIPTNRMQNDTGALPPIRDAHVMRCQAARLGGGRHKDRQRAPRPVPEATGPTRSTSTWRRPWMPCQVSAPGPRARPWADA